MHPCDLIRALQLLQIRDHRGMRDAITQSASFEKECSMDLLSPSKQRETIKFAKIIIDLNSRKNVQIK